MTRAAPPGEAASDFTQPGSATATLLAALLGFFVVTLDAVIVNVALPAVRADLGGGIAGLQWVVDAYTLAFAAFLLSAGSLADRIGAKRAFGWGVGGFVAASAACGLAPSLAMLVGFRLVQGTAAAVVMPSSMALIGQAFPDPVKRGRAVAWWAMGGAVASSAGPVLGGLLTLASWRWIFLVNVPVGAAALVLLVRVGRSARHRAPFDWAGQATGAVAMAALVFGAIDAHRAGPALVVSGIAGVAFAVVQARAKHPMVPPALMRTRAVVVAVVIGFAFMVGYYGMPFVVSLLLQHHGLSALDTGVVFLPMMLTGLVLTPLVPRLVECAGARRVVVSGLLVMTIGLAAVAETAGSAPVWATAALMVLVGLGGPTVIPPVIAVLLAAVPGKQAGIASGVLNTSRQLGGALAVAVFGALLSAGIASGTRVSLLLAAAVAVLAALTAYKGLSRKDRR
ncbi:MFS transporter [Amycolatopsis sp. AA4]|uniref:MFS transporter n=1 Tax=Actinomycetes TaxID=1760 RepID=UPI0001B55B2B|nr:MULTISPECIES: MFS transporter [Actinomycetes]ATY13107.1 MFS transporter [Amycolatopsis sp. AA4]EFL08999.1 predicted protein [Streptomyces sp. AA4]